MRLDATIQKLLNDGEITKDPRYNDKREEKDEA